MLNDPWPCTLPHCTPAGVHYPLSRVNDFTAQYYKLWIENIYQVGNADPQIAANFVKHGDCRGISRFCLLGKRLEGFSCRNAGGHYLPASFFSAGTLWTVRVNDHVTYVAGKALRTAALLPVDHNSCANAITNREVDHIRDILCNPKVPLANGRTVGNRVGKDGNIKVVAQVIQHGKMARMFPSIRFINGSAFKDSTHANCSRFMSEIYDNIYADLANMNQMLNVLRSAINEGCLDKILFGSCIPFCDICPEIQNLENVPFTDEEKQKIYYDNAAKLFNL